MDMGIIYWVHLSTPFVTAYKGKICEENSITYDRFNVMSTNAHNLHLLQRNKDFPTPLE